LARPFRDAELQILRESLAQLRSHYHEHGDEAKKLITFGESKPDVNLNPSELAAWTLLTNQLLNLDEVLNK
jgi:hypothetical protein